MADTITTNFHWVKPEPHASPLDWGIKINADLDLIDAKVYALDSGINASNQILLNKTTVAAGNPIYGELNGVVRWAIEVGDGVAETGSNAGSNFAVYRYTDAGAFIDTPFSINRASGQATFLSPLTCRSTFGATDAITISSAANPTLSLNSTSAQKGWLAYITSGDYVQLNKNGGANLVLSSTIALNGATTVVGALTATYTIGCKSAALITAADGSDNAYAGFYNSAGARQGYVGWLVSSSAVTLAKDGGANIQVTSGIALNGPVTATSLTSSNTITGPQIACTNASGTSGFYGVTATFLNTSGSVNIAGNLTVSGVFSNPSDARIKSVINDYDSGLKDLLQLHPVVYRYKNDATHRSHIGLVAQEAELVMPELVSYGKGEIDGVEVDDLRSLDSTALIYALINSVKELKAEIEELKRR